MVESTNQVARALAEEGAAHGTVVVAARQTAGRGRQGRAWESPVGALLLSMVIRPGAEPLLPLRAGLAVARVVGPKARVKWPNDVLLEGRKVAGILVEAQGEAVVLGIGLNVAVDLAHLPSEVAARAGSLSLPQEAIPQVRDRLLSELHVALGGAPELMVAALAARDALAGQAVRWESGGAGSALEGVAEGIEPTGHLRVRDEAGTVHVLDGGEVHLL